MSSAEPDAPEPIVINDGEIIEGHIAIIGRLGSGAYGDVYHVLDMTKCVESAMKVEPMVVEEKILKIEAEVLEVLAQRSKREHMSHYGCGTTQFADEKRTNFSYVLMPLRGPDLFKLQQKCDGKFSDATFLLIGLRSLLALREFHEIGYVHRDIKPDNFAAEAYCDTNALYLIDFGMCRQHVRQMPNGVWKVRRQREKPLFRGNKMYCSASAMQSDQGRVDDLWSWIYMMISFRHRLPWCKMVRDEQLIFCRQQNTTAEKLAPKDPLLSPFLDKILEHLSSLKYYDRPDYKLLANLFMDRLKELKIPILSKYDWYPNKVAYLELERNKVKAFCEKHKVVMKPPPVRSKTEEEELSKLQRRFEQSPTDLPGGIECMETKDAGKSTRGSKDIKTDPSKEPNPKEPNS